MNVYIYFSCLGESEAVARRCSVKKKRVFRKFAKFTGKNLCNSLFFRPATLLKKRLWHSRFPVKTFEGHLFLQNTSGGCFWRTFSSLEFRIHILENNTAVLVLSSACRLFFCVRNKLSFTIVQWSLQYYVLFTNYLLSSTIICVCIMRVIRNHWTSSKSNIMMQWLKCLVGIMNVTSTRSY